jgi:hypothetical protein
VSGDSHYADMTFWNWRRGSAAGVAAGSAAVALTGRDLAPIELYTADARIVGWIAANGQRVTDLLNDQDELRLWHPSPGPIVEPTGAEGADLEPGEETGEWQSVVTEQLILAMPPEWRAARQLRLHRKLRRVALSAGPFSVTGNLHLSPTAETDPIPYEGRRFLPLTDAYILHNGEPPFEHVVSVVIVNTAHITQLVPLVTLA